MTVDISDIAYIFEEVSKTLPSDSLEATQEYEPVQATELGKCYGIFKVQCNLVAFVIQKKNSSPPEIESLTCKLSY